MARAKRATMSSLYNSKYRYTVVKGESTGKTSRYTQQSTLRIAYLISRQFVRI